MARKTALKNTLVMGPNVAAEAESNSLTDNTAAYIDSTELDERTAIRLEADGTNASVVTISKGTGYNGAADLTIALAATDVKYITLDSSRFAIVGGEDAGLIKITATKGIKVEVAQLKV